MPGLLDRLVALTPGELGEYRRWTDAYESACAEQDGPEPPPEAYLPASDPPAGLVLLQNLKVVLEHRSGRGEPVGLDDVLARYPTLADDDESLVEVLAWGSRMADSASGRPDPGPTLTELAERFPRLREALVARRVALYRELGGTFPAELVPPGATLIHELPPGGMSRLALVWIEEVGREEVLKVMDPLARDDAEAVERFRREIRLAAGRPGARVVTVHRAGTIGRHLYYTMPHLRGGSLRDRLRAGGLGREEGVRMLAAVARSVHALHTQEPRAVHRDLKPENILFAGPGTDEPWVADLGLARLLGETAPAEPLTARGTFYLGTPGYMAPEQVWDDDHRVDHRADVHALGAILYELLTGRPPYREERPDLTALSTRKGLVLEPRQVDPRVPRDLEIIALKALATDPRDRFPTAEALADDLQRWLDGRPILARPPSAWDRARSVARRHPGSTALAALVALLLVGWGASATALLLGVRAQKGRADRNAWRLASTLGQQAERLGLDAEEARGTQPVRTAPINKQLGAIADALETLADENAGIGSVELGTTLNRLALIRLILGDAPSALESSERAEALFAALPPGPPARAGLAIARLHSGRILAALDRHAEARPRTEQAAGLLRDLVAERPDDMGLRFGLARAELNLGNHALEAQPAEAVGRYQAALGQLATLRQAGDRPLFLEWDARARSNLGLALVKLDRKAEAVEAQSQAADLAAQLVALSPGAPRPLDCLAACRNNLGEALAAIGRGDEAAAAYRAAVEAYQGLARLFPDEPEGAWGVAMTQTNLASVLGRSGRWAEADALLRQAGPAFDRLARLMPDNPALRADADTSRALADEARAHLQP